MLEASTSQYRPVNTQNTQMASTPKTSQHKSSTITEYTHRDSFYSLIAFYGTLWQQLTSSYQEDKFIIAIAKDTALNIQCNCLEDKINELKINELKTIFSVLDYIEKRINSMPKSQKQEETQQYVYIISVFKKKIIEHCAYTPSIKDDIIHFMNKHIQYSNIITLKSLIENNFLFYKEFIKKTMPLHYSEDIKENLYFVYYLYSIKDQINIEPEILISAVNEFKYSKKGKILKQYYSFDDDIELAIQLYKWKSPLELYREHLKILNDSLKKDDKVDLFKKIHLSQIHLYKLLKEKSLEQNTEISNYSIYVIMQNIIEQSNCFSPEVEELIKNKKSEIFNPESLDQTTKDHPAMKNLFLTEEECKAFLHDINLYCQHKNSFKKYAICQKIKRKYSYILALNSPHLLKIILKKTNKDESLLIDIFPHYTVDFLMRNKNYKLDVNDPYFFQHVFYLAFSQYEYQLSQEHPPSLTFLYDNQEIQNSTYNMFLAIKNEILSYRIKNIGISKRNGNIILRKGEINSQDTTMHVFNSPQDLFNIATITSHFLFEIKNARKFKKEKTHYFMCNRIISDILNNFSNYNKFKIDISNTVPKNNTQTYMSPPLFTGNTPKESAKENLTIEAQPDTNIVYVQLNSFLVDNYQEELRKYNEVLDMEGKGYQVVFDVRNNKGGYAAYCNSLIDKLSELKNMIILVNQSSASASERFASTLKENGNYNFVIGTQTHGKGVTCNDTSLIFGHKKATLNHTIGEYGVPVHGESGIEQKSIHIDGVTPNILIHPLNPEHLGKVRSERAGNFYGSYLEQRMEKLQSIPDYQFYCREEDTEDFIDALSTALTTTLQQERANENANTALTIHHDAIKKTILETAWTYEQKVQALSRQKGFEIKLQSDLSSAVIPTIKASDISVQVLFQKNPPELSGDYDLVLKNHSPYPLHNVHLSLNPVFRLLLNNDKEYLNELLECSCFIGSHHKTSNLTIKITGSSLTNQDQLKYLYAIIESTQLDRPVITKLWPHN
jgi:hypothetical protein